ncbi:MAG: glutaredoxin family protein [Microcella sp.]
MSSNDATVVYGKDGCTDTQRSRALLDGAAVTYVFHRVDLDEAAAAEAQRLSGGPRVPVIVTPAGDVMVEPSDSELAAALGIADTSS